MGCLDGLQGHEFRRWYYCGFSPEEVIAARDMAVNEKLRSMLGMRQEVDLEEAA
jgi:hypothetical protein